MSTICKSGLASLVLTAAALGGCATLDVVEDKRAAYRENVPKLDPDKIEAYVMDQTKIYDKLAKIEPVTGTDYTPIVRSGMMYVDLRCARYMDALFWFNRVKEGANRQLGYLGSASAAILEILDASSELVSLAPIGFKFATETMDSVGKGLLYDISPGAVRDIVEEQQNAFKKAIENQSYGSKTTALQVVQAYLMLCLPASIEGQVEQAVKGAKFKEKERPTAAASGDDALPTKTVEVVTTTQSRGGKALTTSSTTTTTTVSPPAPPEGMPREAKENKVPILEMVGGD